MVLKAAEMAADWWVERLQQGDRKAFRDYIVKAVSEQLPDAKFIRLECDYDPCGILLEAVRAAGVECRGFMFSAKGILPEKHSLKVRIDRLEPKEGYGNWTDAIPVQSRWAR